MGKSAPKSYSSRSFHERRKAKQTPSAAIVVHRLIVGGIITLVAAFFLYAILRPILAPIADVVAVDSHERFMADGNSMGHPNA